MLSAVPESAASPHHLAATATTAAAKEVPPPQELSPFKAAGSEPRKADCATKMTFSDSVTYALQATECPPVTVSEHSPLIGQTERVREATQPRAGCCRGLKEAGRVGLLFFVLMAGSVSMLVIGALYLTDCPARRSVPQLLLGLGGATLLRVVCAVGRRLSSCLQQQQPPQEDPQPSPRQALQEPQQQPEQDPTSSPGQARLEHQREPQDIQSSPKQVLQEPQQQPEQYLQSSPKQAMQEPQKEPQDHQSSPKQTMQEPQQEPQQDIQSSPKQAQQEPQQQPEQDPRSSPGQPQEPQRQPEQEPESSPRQAIQELQQQPLQEPLQYPQPPPPQELPGPRRHRQRCVVVLQWAVSLLDVIVFCLAVLEAVQLYHLFLVTDSNPTRAAVPDAPSYCHPLLSRFSIAAVTATFAALLFYVVVNAAAVVVPGPRPPVTGVGFGAVGMEESDADDLLLFSSGSQPSTPGQG